MIRNFQTVSDWSGGKRINIATCHMLTRVFKTVKNKPDLK
jgi:hypothetical protein